MIDNIERNIMATVSYVEVAKNETKAAVVYQSKARRVRDNFKISSFSSFSLTNLCLAT